MWSWLVLGLQPTESEEPEFTSLLAAMLALSVVIYGTYFLWGRWLLSWLSLRGNYRPFCFRPVQRSQPVKIPAAPVLLASFWIAATLFLQFSGSPSGELPEFNALAAMLVGMPLGIAAFLLLVWEFSGEEYRLQDFFHVSNWKDDLKAGAEIFLLAMPWTLALGFLSQLWKEPEDTHVLLQLLQRNEDGLALLLLIILAAACIAPLVEELMFRVLLLNGLWQQGQLPRWAAVLTASVIFCLVHGWQDALQLLPLSLCLGWCMALRQSFLAVVTGHALFNGFMIALALLQSSPAG